MFLFLQRNIYFVLENPKDLVSVSSDTSHLSSSKLNCHINNIMLINHAVNEQIHSAEEGAVISNQLMNDWKLQNRTFFWWVQMFDKNNVNSSIVLSLQQIWNPTNIYNNYSHVVPRTDQQMIVWRIAASCNCNCQCYVYTFMFMDN